MGLHMHDAAVNYGADMSISAIESMTQWKSPVTNKIDHPRVLVGR